jgi:hypothetical protein
MFQLRIVHIVSFLRKRKLLSITGHRQDAISLNEQDARNVLVYDFRLKWGSNESIMGTRFQHRNCFLLIIHRSALFTHPLCKCISTLRVIPNRIRNHYRHSQNIQIGITMTISCGKPWMGISFASWNQKNSLPSIGASPKLSLHSRVRCWAMESTFLLHVSFGTIVVARIDQASTEEVHTQKPDLWVHMTLDKNDYKPSVPTGFQWGQVLTWHVNKLSGYYKCFITRP